VREGRHESLRVDGFEDAAGEACRQHFALRFFSGVAGERQQRNRAPGSVCAQRAQNLIAIHHRQVEVAQDEVRAILERGAHAGAAIGSPRGRVARLA
jgi:hypothetical protein